MAEKAEVDLKQRDLLERLRALTRDGRRPLSELLRLSEDSADDGLRPVRSFLFDLFCQIYAIDPESEEGARLRFRFLQELARGQSVEEVASLFIGNLYLAEHGLRDVVSLQRPEPAVRPRSLAERARLVIERDFADRISLNSIAQELAVSKEHLSRIFKKKFSVTVTEYVHQVRIEKARSLIRSGSAGLKQVCYETGYQSYNDFYRNFRKVTGVSPKDFVESAGGAADVP